MTHSTAFQPLQLLRLKNALGGQMKHFINEEPVQRSYFQFTEVVGFVDPDLIENETKSLSRQQNLEAEDQNKETQTLSQKLQTGVKERCNN